MTTTTTKSRPAPVEPRIFICTDCGRQHNSPTSATPEGWDLLAMDCGGAPLLRCPDCAERIEQAHFDRMAEFMATQPGSNAASDLAQVWRATTPAPSPFSVFLEKQDAGDYRVALMPEAVLMRWLPLGFFLTPTEARATARELMLYAAQAERPGKLVEQGSAAA